MVSRGQVPGAAVCIQALSLCVDMESRQYVTQLLISKDVILTSLNDEEFPTKQPFQNAPPTAITTHITLFFFYHVLNQNQNQKYTRIQLLGFSKGPIQRRLLAREHTAPLYSPCISTELFRVVHCAALCVRKEMFTQ